MKSLAQIPVDMLLAGHFHVAGTTRTATRYKIDNFSALIVASGTTISTRGRGQPNSLNVIRIETSTITIAQHQWRTQTGAFDLFSTERFVLRFKGSWNEVKGKLKQSTRSSLTTT
jgi:3',5'-cyclic AMP phosphodiesterase CpdA